MAANIGKIVTIIGPVLDVEFEPENLPELLTALEVKTEGIVRRGRLYYLRNLTGKAARIRTRRRG